VFELIIHQAHLYVVDIFAFYFVIIHRNLQKVTNLKSFQGTQRDGFFIQL